MLLLLLALQVPLPTVGDTIWLERSVELPPGATIRPAAWDPEGDIALLGRPVVRQEGTVATVAYPAVAWSAGTRTILVPGPIVIHRDGVTDSLPAEPRTIEVASVLPAGEAPGQIGVRPELGIVPERVRSAWPLVGALALALLLFLPLAWWWRRRGPVAVVGSPLSGSPEPPVAEWSEAGEPRAVAAAAARALRGAITSHLPGTAPGLVTSRLVRTVDEQRPSWPTAEIALVLRSLESAQYAGVANGDVVDLAQRAQAIRARLEASA